MREILTKRFEWDGDLFPEFPVDFSYILFRMKKKCATAVWIVGGVDIQVNMREIPLNICQHSLIHIHVLLPSAIDNNPKKNFFLLMFERFNAYTRIVDVYFWVFPSFCLFSTNLTSINLIFRLFIVKKHQMCPLALLLVIWMYGIVIMIIWIGFEQIYKFLTKINELLRFKFFHNRHFENWSHFKLLKLKLSFILSIYSKLSFN